MADYDDDKDERNPFCCANDKCECGGLSDMSISTILKFNPLYMDIQPSKFILSPDADKPTKYVIKCLSKVKQEVIVNMYSYIFEIQNSRHKYGVFTQFYHVFEPGQTMDLIIGIRASKDLSFTELALEHLMNPFGVLQISHYRSWKKDDSDKEWFNKINGRACIHKLDRNYYGHWEVKLAVEHETDDIKDRKKVFAVKLLKTVEKKADEIREKKKKAFPLMLKDYHPAPKSDYSGYSAMTVFEGVPSAKLDANNLKSVEQKTAAVKEPEPISTVAPIKKKKKILGCC
ncbi:CP2 domain-containing protein [Caenorhabditis elegans]|uniref:CP2 domain-containing protein n=1 Tax=Caenorhabditis elegans TaxID=6239 RepID=Q9XW04_CAEEL|nr:CP2 domain-containing protein [Caenorhabditis elegans]CAA22331.2 CP2 domain-containing protein [Caenorhabditis elegans]|eukprot:NP_493259.2 Uncharacterized protein CELE_Y18D10A.21 [Caenorhabditis elegans]